MTKKVLFVCTGNYDRSPTAENMYKNVKGLEVKSAGISIAAQNSR
jgi:protein-tyrosine-phosphatase